jgi:nitroreductase
MQLAAWVVGLDSLIVSITDQEKLRMLFKYPPELETIACLHLSYPRRPRPRRQRGEVLHRNAW